MKPLIHAQLSVKKYGGKVDDYLPIHNFIDSSKIADASPKHRAMLHSTWGIYLAEQMFGTYITNSEGKNVSVRDVAEEHVAQDMGFIPTMNQWLAEMKLQPWMTGSRKRTKRLIDFKID